MKSLPSWIEKCLRMICPEEMFDQIAGDLIELYHHDTKTVGEQRAKGRLILSALRFLRPGILLRNRISLGSTPGILVHHYIKATFRHSVKNKLNFSFKLLGLVLALLSFFVIVLYVSYQLSFDRFHDDYRNIYRVNSHWRENGDMAGYAIVPAGVGPMLKNEFPEVLSYTRLNGPSRYLIRHNEKSFHAEGIAHADSTIFDVLSFTFLAGDKRALQDAAAIVLTKSLATQIFGNEDPMNRFITFIDHNDVTLQVTGVVEDVPQNSHLNIKALTSFGALTDSSDVPAGPWDITIDGSTTLYVRLEANSKPEVFTLKVLPHIKRRITPDESGRETDYAISLQPLADIYLDTRMYAEFCVKGNPVYVYVFSVLGFFLLVISSINYVNLSIADFHKRNKEIGVRKIMGARKKQIACQVVLEAVLISLLSLAISLSGLCLLFPQVVQMLDSNLAFTMLLAPNVMVLVAGVVALLILLSTAYPAYQLAMNNPVDDLKAGRMKARHLSISKILLLSQISISVICISVTFVLAQQLQFIQRKNPGYDRHNLIVVAMPDRYPPEKNSVIKDEFGKLAGVEAVSFSTFRIAGAGYYRDWYRVEIDGEMKQVMLNEVFFDHDFFRTTGIPLVAGRSFDPERSTDSHEAFIVNETAVRAFGWDDPLGKRILYGYEDTEGERWEGTVVGVVEDFNVYSLHKKIEPLVMRLPWSDWPGNCVHIRIHGSLDETIRRIKAKYEEILPGFLLNYSVVDELYDSQYHHEKKAYTTLRLSTWVIVAISALGIFSLSLCVSVTRMKEFGIRKVLGATAGQITILQTAEFIKIALLANAFALPIALVLSYRWLDEFAYRTEVNELSFLSIAMVSLCLVLFSAVYAAWKSGKRNPIDVIKTEG